MGDASGRVHCGLEDGVAEAGIFFILLDARHVFKHPFAAGAIGEVVEGVHAGVAEAVLCRVGVPALPGGGSAHLDCIQPGGHGVLKQQIIGHVGAADLGQHRQDDVDAEEADLEGVLRTVGADGLVFIADALEKIFNINVPLGFIFVEAKLERPEQSGLGIVHGTSAAGKDVAFRIYIVIHKLGGQSFSKLTVLLRMVRFSKLVGYLFHNLRNVDMVKSVHNVQGRAAECQPVAKHKRIIAVSVDILDIAFHIGIEVPDDGQVSCLLVQRPGQNDADIGPT